MPAARAGCKVGFSFWRIENFSGSGKDVSRAGGHGMKRKARCPGMFHAGFEIFESSKWQYFS